MSNCKWKDFSDFERMISETDSNYKMWQSVSLHFEDETKAIRYVLTSFSPLVWKSETHYSWSRLWGWELLVSTFKRGLQYLRLCLWLLSKSCWICEGWCAMSVFLVLLQKVGLCKTPHYRNDRIALLGSFSSIKMVNCKVWKYEMDTLELNTVYKKLNHYIEPDLCSNKLCFCSNKCE